MRQFMCDDLILLTINRCFQLHLEPSKIEKNIKESWLIGCLVSIRKSCVTIAETKNIINISEAAPEVT